MRTAFIALVLCCAPASGGQLRPDVSIRPPIVLRFEGSFAADRERARADGADAVGMRIGENRRWFSARDVRTVGGDPGVSARTILNALAPYDEILVVGDASLRQRLAEASPGTRVRVDGLIDAGARTYLLRDVVVVGPAP